MLIKYPTGLYGGVLPKSPGDGGNVTFTISGPPPRAGLLFPKLPPGVSSRRRQPSAITREQRREHMDALVYSTSRSSRAALGTSSKQWEIGQVLDFGDPEDRAPTADLLLTGVGGETQHDVGLLDYARAGLGAVEAAEAVAKSEVAYRAKRARLAAVREEHLGLQVGIAEDQKTINETAKIVAALVAIGDPGMSGTVELLEARKAALLRKRGGDVNRANELVREAASLNSDLLALAKMVR